MRSLTLIAAVPLALWSAGAQSTSQAPARVIPPGRVRVQLMTSASLVGTVVSADSSTLVLAPGGPSSPYRIRVQDIVGIDTAAGVRHRFGRGLAIGLGAGVLAGGLLGALTYEPCHEVGFLACFMAPGNRADAATLGAAAGGVLGVLLGGIIGAASTTERWAPVNLAGTVQAVHLSVAPTPRGFGVTGSLRF